jgi:hypothetical protein
VLREPWATLLTEDFQAATAGNTTNPDRDLEGRGSKMSALVAPAGFEPATPALGDRPTDSTGLSPAALHDSHRLDRRADRSDQLRFVP